MSPPLEAGHGPFWGMGMKSEEFISNCMQASSWNAMRLEFENKGRRVAYYAKDKKVFWASSGLDGLSPVWRSEEHTSELQSLMRISYAVFCLKKKTRKT